jgi:hypothetical protein
MTQRKGASRDYANAPKNGNSSVDKNGVINTRGSIHISNDIQEKYDK